MLVGDGKEGLCLVDSEYSGSRIFFFCIGSSGGGVARVLVTNFVMLMVVMRNDGVADSLRW